MYVCLIATNRRHFRALSTVTSSYLISDHRRRQNSCPGVNLLPSWLLQLHVIRYVRRPFSEDTVDPERRCTSGHWDLSMWAHHTDAASIAVDEWLQDCMSVHQSLVGQTPSWRHPTCDGHWSPSSRTCLVPRTYNSFGDRSFSAAGPRVWNSLSPQLRQDMNFVCFQHKLKTFLFGCYSTTAHHDYLLFCAIEILLFTYYLLTYW